MLIPGYKSPDLSPIDVKFFEQWRIYIRVLGESRRYQAPSSAVVRHATSLPAKFFLVFRRHFCWCDWTEKTGIRHSVPAPIAGLDVVTSVVGTEWRHIQILEITVYLLGHTNTRIQNPRSVINLRPPVLRKMLNIYPAIRTVEVSGAL
jgi:hypothetical protein